MGQWKQFTFEERQKIEAFIKEGHTRRYIARALNRSKSTICAEIRRCGEISDYSAQTAQEDFIKKRARSSCLPGKYVDLDEHEKRIIQLREKGFTLKQIAKQIGTSYYKLHSYIYRNASKSNSLNEIDELKQRIENIEMQLEIILDVLKDKL